MRAELRRFGAYLGQVITTAGRSRPALLVALGVDNFGTGLFAPLVVVYAHVGIGLDLATAGTLLTVGSLLGLSVPPLAGKLVDRFGAKAVVVIAQLVQAAGASVLLLAHDGVGALVAAALLAGGLQLFFGSLFTLVLDVGGSGSAERSFALVGVVRGVPFGIGTLLGAVVLETGAFRTAIAVDIATYLACALLLATLVTTAPPERTDGGGYRAVLRDRSFLLLVTVHMLIALALDVFVVGAAVYLTEVLAGPAWAPGVSMTLNTLLSLAAALAVVRLVKPLRRTTALAFSGLCTLVWALAVSATPLFPTAVQPWFFLLLAMLLTLGNLIMAPVGFAIVESLAPPPLRGRYLALAQYSFTVAQLLAPAVVGLFPVAIWLPWAVVAGAAALGTAGALLLRRTVQ